MLRKWLLSPARIDRDSKSRQNKSTSILCGSSLSKAFARAIASKHNASDARREAVHDMRLRFTWLLPTHLLPIPPVEDRTRLSSSHLKLTGTTTHPSEPPVMCLGSCQPTLTVYPANIVRVHPPGLRTSPASGSASALSRLPRCPGQT